MFKKIKSFKQKAPEKIMKITNINSEFFLSIYDMPLQLTGGKLHRQYDRTLGRIGDCKQVLSQMSWMMKSTATSWGQLATDSTWEVQQCKRLYRRSLVVIVECPSHCFSPIKELSATECQRLMSAAVTDTAEWPTSELCNSKHKKIYDHATSSLMHYMLLCKGLAAAVLIWMLGDP